MALKTVKIYCMELVIMYKSLKEISGTSGLRGMLVNYVKEKELVMLVGEMIKIW